MTQPQQSQPGKESPEEELDDEELEDEDELDVDELEDEDDEVGAVSAGLASATRLPASPSSLGAPGGTADNVVDALPDTGFALSPVEQLAVMPIPNKTTV